MTKLETANVVVQYIVGAGTATIVHTIIKNNVQPDNFAQKVTVAAASIALGSMVADVTTRYTGAQMFKLATWYDENVKKN